MGPAPINGEHLKASFNSASESKLLTDSDSCVPDTDPNPSKYDDVILGVEFFISPASSEVFPPEFSEDKYNNISTIEAADALGIASFTDIKLVASISLPGGNDAIGRAELFSHNVTLRNDCDNWPDTALLHEWGHNIGLEHRGNGSNPGLDPVALMYPQDQGGTEINRNERSSMSLGD